MKFLRWFLTRFYSALKLNVCQGMNNESMNTSRRILREKLGMNFKSRQPQNECSFLTFTKESLFGMGAD